MGKKLKLESIKIQSFVTNLENNEKSKVKGVGVQIPQLTVTCHVDCTDYTCGTCETDCTCTCGSGDPACPCAAHYPDYV